ncbi:GTPase IMAP family member GIMD1 [Discoglossus pictus]
MSLRSSMSESNEITINLLLLGKTKSGKSSLGNSLLGSYEFESQFFPRSVTEECRLCRIRIPQFARRMGRDLCLKLQVLDTPGSPHSSLNQEEVKQSVKRGLAQQLSEGLHMALLVLRADVPYCEEDNQHTIKLAEDLLGPEWNNFTTVLFTHGDQLLEAKMDEDEYIMLAPKYLSTLLKSVHDRYIFRNPQGKTLHEERKILTKKIFNFVRQNSYQWIEFK